MKFLTSSQKRWIGRKTIKVGEFYMFPPMGFTVYIEPNHLRGMRLDTNPFTKSLAGEYFLVKEKINGFCKGNFYDKPKGVDIYLLEDELSGRSLLEIVFLFLVSFIPLSIYNLLRGGVDRIEKEKVI